MSLPDLPWRNLQIASIVGLLALVVGINAYGWWTYTKPPVAPVELLDATLETDRVEVGGALSVEFGFIKNREDCDNGRANRYVWNADGTWIQVVAEKRVRQAPKDDEAQAIRVDVPLINAANGKPVPPGQWSLHTMIVYDCPHNGGFIAMDKTINTPLFEIVANNG